MQVQELNLVQMFPGNLGGGAVSHRKKNQDDHKPSGREGKFIVALDMLMAGVRLANILSFEFCYLLLLESCMNKRTKVKNIWCDIKLIQVMKMGNVLW